MTLQKIVGRLTMSELRGIVLVVIGIGTLVNYIGWCSTSTLALVFGLFGGCARLRLSANVRQLVALSGNSSPNSSALLW